MQRFFWIKENGGVEEIDWDQFVKLEKNTTKKCQYKLVSVNEKGLQLFNIPYITWNNFQELMELTFGDKLSA